MIRVSLQVIKKLIIRFKNHKISFSSYIFIFTCRTTLIFWLTHSLKFGECFRYLQRAFKIIFHASGAVWNENLLQKWKKKLEFSRCFKSDFGDFFKLPFYVSFNIFCLRCFVFLEIIIVSGAPRFSFYTLLYIIS